MVNTRILVLDFKYLEPRSIEEAIANLSEYNRNAKIIAGGTDLLVQMKMERISPGLLINIKKITQLDYINELEGIKIGAITTFSKIEESDVIRKKYSALFEAAHLISSTQIKNMGTIGGNLCNASPAADSAPPLLVFDSKLKIADRKGERIISLKDFFIGPGEKALSPDELLVAIDVPPLSSHTGSAFSKIGRVSADIAKLSVAVLIEKDGDLCKSCKIALGAVAKTPMRAIKAEEVLVGKKFSLSLSEEAARIASEEIQPIDDIRSTGEYRRDVSKVLVRDTLMVAYERAS